ncbi:cupin domain-containing protein [Deminuibacter soli]|uniref:Cupin domain-containing protein n=1 Tax=Deminuibacter soli TaxID=2291815 RepID=A0A3E1NFS8_9BACT|nr:cupin domain-containing protein [Deminuibacter soli]RFM26823.1 cupin domain-containing protein [Deminuibacter soli]
MALSLIDPHEILKAVTGSYSNTTISTVNDQVVRMSVMQKAYPWHRHPNSDELFIGVQGVLVIEFERHLVELTAGQLLLVPRNVLHRTFPKGDQSVNLTIESKDMQTEFDERD